VKRSKSVTWDQISAAFAFDGSLRDIYILAATLQDWQAVWSVLREHVPPPTYSINGVFGPMPADMGDILDAAGAPHLVSLRLGPMLINCHFYSSSEIELDVDPREVANSDAAEQLLDFMSSLGRATGKDVLLTEENHPQYEFLRVRPNGSVQPHPSLTS